MDFGLSRTTKPDVKKAIEKLRSDPAKRLLADPKAVGPREDGKPRPEVRKRPRA